MFISFQAIRDALSPTSSTASTSTDHDESPDFRPIDEQGETETVDEDLNVSSLNCSQVPRWSVHTC